MSKALDRAQSGQDVGKLIHSIFFALLLRLLVTLCLIPKRCRWSSLRRSGTVIFFLVRGLCLWVESVSLSDLNSVL